MTARTRAARNARLRHLHSTRLPRRGGGRRWLPVIVLALVGLFVGSGIAAAATGVAAYRHYVHTVKGLGDVNQVLSENAGPAKIYDRHGNLLYQFQDPNKGLRDPLPLDKISPWVVKATVDTEDNTFWTNNGLNMKGLFRAALQNIGVGSGTLFAGSGGSSITQQLCKNVFIFPVEERYQRSVDRKLKETVCALELTRRLPKQEILDRYLNTIFYGNNTYGIGAAARFYFDKSAADLDIAESALLAGIPQQPLAYDPLAHFTDAKARQEQVLDLMVRQGDITPERAAAAKAEKLVFHQSPLDIYAPHFVFYVEQQLKQMLGCSADPSAKCDALFIRGLRVYTTLDLGLQQKAEQIVRDSVTKFAARGCRCNNGAAVILDNHTGEVLAMVGSRDFTNRDIGGQFNYATAQDMQPGSAFKPFVYLSAFLRGMFPASVVWDTPKAFKNGPGQPPFIPSGPGPYLGPLIARAALANSINAPAVKTAAFAGVENILTVAHRVGIDSMYDPGNYGPSIATGGSRISLLDLAFGYTALANNGELRGQPVKNPAPGHPTLAPVSILKVEDPFGKVVYEFKEPSSFQAEPANYVYLVSNILQDVEAKKPLYGPTTSNFVLSNGQPIAGKTGTQQGRQSDKQILYTWTFGFIPDISVGVWVGNTDQHNSYDMAPSVISINTALPMWHDIFQAAVDYLKIPRKPFPMPPGVIKRTVVVPQIGGKSCYSPVEVFASENVPQSTNFCSVVKIDKRTGLLATSDTPPQFVEERYYLQVPPDEQQNAGDLGIPTGTPPSTTATPSPTLPPGATATPGPGTSPTQRPPYFGPTVPPLPPGYGR